MLLKTLNKLVYIVNVVNDRVPDLSNTRRRQPYYYFSVNLSSLAGTQYMGLDFGPYRKPAGWKFLALSPEPSDPNAKEPLANMG